MSIRSRSERELFDRLLKKGVDGGDAERIISRLKSLGYLDDRALASSLRRKAETDKLYGLSGARQYLRRMGVADEAAGDALRDYDETAAAKKLIEKKARKGLRLTGKTGPDDRAGEMRRLSAMLSRRGFKYETIRMVLKTQMKTMTENDDD